MTILGYTVKSVDNSAFALDVFSREPHSFSLVILDQIMPGLTGINTAKAMLQIRPDTPIALLTGWYLSDSTKQYAKAVGIRVILEKPITVRQLGKAIRQIIGTNEKG